MSRGLPSVPAAIVTDPPGVTIGNVEPGHSYTTTVSLTNTFAFPVRIGTVVSRDGVLFQGAHPLEVTFAVVGAGGACPAAADALPAGSHVVVRVDAAFPLAAGNEYQLQSGDATLFFTATQITDEQCAGSLGSTPTPAPTAAPTPGATAAPGTTTATGSGGPGGLPGTGLEVSAVAAACVALVLLGAVVRLLVRRRRRAAG